MFQVCTYRVSHIDGIEFKELLWFHFWCQAFSPIIFMVEKYVHFDTWNKKCFHFTFQRVSFRYDLAHFSNLELVEYLKNEPNYRGDSLNFFIPITYENIHIFPP